MAVNHENSLGWLALQSRQREADRQTAEMQQVRQERRESDQRAGEQGLQIVEHQLAAHDAAENRKLQLAGMLQKQTEIDAAKERMKNAELEANKPKNDSVVTKNISQANLNDYERTENRPHDNAIDDGKLFDRRNQTAEMQRYHDMEMQSQHEGHMMSFGGRLLSAADANGRPLYTPAQAGGMIPSLTSALGLAHAPDAPEGFDFATKEERKDAGKNLGDAAEMSNGLGTLADTVRKANPKYFGPYQAGTDITMPKWLPGFGGKQIHLGGNSWQDLEANAGKLGPDEKKMVDERRALMQQYTPVFQALRQKMTGAAFSDKESREYATRLTGFNDNLFDNDPELLAKALERAQQHADRRTQLLDLAAHSGLVPKNYYKLSNNDLAKAIEKGKAAVARPAVTNEAYTKELTDKATAKAAAKAESAPTADDYYAAKLKEFNGDEAKAAKATFDKFGAPQ